MVSGRNTVAYKIYIFYTAKDAERILLSVVEFFLEVLYSIDEPRSNVMVILRVDS